MKSVSIDPAIEANPEWRDAVARVTAIYEDECDFLAKDVDLTYRLAGPDAEFGPIEVMLTDVAGSVKTTFGPDSFDPDDWFRVRLRRRWLDLLANRSRYHRLRVDRLLAKLEAEEAEEADNLKEG